MNPDHRPKYVYLLAYAASVCEQWRRSQRSALNQEELRPTIAALERVHSIASHSKSTLEIMSELNALYQCIRSVQWGRVVARAFYALSMLEVCCGGAPPTEEEGWQDESC